MANRLPHRSALITGGGSGIGEATAVLFASEGARVAIAGRDEKRLQRVAARIEESGGTILTMVTDVRRPGDVHDLVQLVHDSWSSLDIVVNSAGVDTFEPVADISDAEWQQVLDTNLNGVFHICREALPVMSKSGGGSIVNIASINAFVGVPGMSAYGAAKGAVVALTKQMAIDYGPHGVRVNSICPGSIDTPMFRRSLGEGEDSARSEAAMIDLYPIGRIGNPLDVAFGALYLASEESSFVTGTALVIDGGYTAK